jgi:predicted Fe-S protein YdhL (DUF1289 family)
MRSEIRTPDYTNIILIVLGVVSVLYILAVLGGVQLPLISGYKAGTIVLGIVGMAMCTVGGIGPAVRRHGWSHPMTILGTVRGFMLVVVLATIFNIQLPLIAGERDAFLAVVILGAARSCSPICTGCSRTANERKRRSVHQSRSRRPVRAGGSDRVERADGQKAPADRQRQSRRRRPGRRWDSHVQPGRHRARRRQLRLAGADHRCRSGAGRHRGDSDSRGAVRIRLLSCEPSAVFVALAVVMLAKWVIAVAPWPG